MTFGVMIVLGVTEEVNDGIVLTGDEGQFLYYNIHY